MDDLPDLADDPPDLADDPPNLADDPKKKIYSTGPCRPENYWHAVSAASPTSL